MAGPPPPYSDYHAGYIYHKTPEVRTPSIRPRSQTSFKHKHDVYLISVPQHCKLQAFDLDRAGRSFLYTLPTSEAGLRRFAVTQQISSEQLSSTQGYNDRGPLTISMDTFDESGIERAVHNSIHPHLQEHPSSDPVGVGNSGEAESYVIKGHLHKFHVYVEAVDFINDAIAETVCFLFKWSKPESVYGGTFGLSGA